MSASGKRRRVAAAVASVVLSAGLFASLGPLGSSASSHREAPLISADPQVDNTDVYAFVSPDRPDTVTLISSWIPFEEPAGGPNFYPWAEGARYDIRIDNDGDARPDLIYRWVFSNHYRSKDTFLYNTGQVTSLKDKDLNFYQTYDLRRIEVGKGSKELVEGAVSVPSNVGQASMPDFTSLSDEGIVSFGGGRLTWAGQSDDPFFLDLRVFDLLYGANLSEVGDDTLAGFNVNTMALQVPQGDLAKDGDAEENPVIGIWSTASRKSLEGGWVQVSRLGNPLVNEVVVPVGSKDYFNSSKPSGDAAFLPKVEDPELPHLLNAVYGLPVPDSDPNEAGIQRDDLVSVFLTGVKDLNGPVRTPSEQLRLNMSIPPCATGCSTLGVIGGDVGGFPNGRRLSDDVIDIALQVVEGELIGSPNDLGDGVGANDVPFIGSFPYVAYAHSGSDASPH